MLWQIGLGHGNSTPVLSGDTAVVHGLARDTCAYKLTPQTAEKMWVQHDYTDANRGLSPLIFQDHVYIVGGTYRPYEAVCFDLRTGEKKWEAPNRRGSGCDSSLLADGKIIRASLQKLMMLKATPDKFTLLAETVNVKAEGGSSPAIAGGMLYVRLKDCIACYDLTAAGN